VEDEGRSGEERNTANSRPRGARLSRYSKALLFKKFCSKNILVLYGREPWYFSMREGHWLRVLRGKLAPKKEGTRQSSIICRELHILYSLPNGIGTRARNL
jgi:hypothetical protein